MGVLPWREHAAVPEERAENVLAAGCRQGTRVAATTTVLHLEHTHTVNVGLQVCSSHCIYVNINQNSSEYFS